MTVGLMVNLFPYKNSAATFFYTRIEGSPRSLTLTLRVMGNTRRGGRATMTLWAALRATKNLNILSHWGLTLESLKRRMRRRRWVMASHGLAELPTPWLRGGVGKLRNSPFRPPTAAQVCVTRAASYTQAAFSYLY